MGQLFLKISWDARGRKAGRQTWCRPEIGDARRRGDPGALETAILGGSLQGIFRTGLAKQCFLNGLLQGCRKLLVFRRRRTRIHGGQRQLGRRDQFFLVLADGCILIG
ncbi:hypothetical protein D3C86_2018020 [compost metagenome]